MWVNNHSGCGLSLNSSTNFLQSNEIHNLIYITSELRREEKEREGKEGKEEREEKKVISTNSTLQ